MSLLDQSKSIYRRVFDHTEREIDINLAVLRKYRRLYGWVWLKLPFPMCMTVHDNMEHYQAETLQHALARDTLVRDCHEAQHERA